mgnify:CR=1 FL=1
MIKEFYDGKIRPLEELDWSEDELDRVCLNCNERFGQHGGYRCPDDK